MAWVWASVSPTPNCHRAWSRPPRSSGLPLLEIPEPTPFMAISKAVSELLAKSDYEAVTRTVEAQRELTRAALAPEGAAAVVVRLAAALVCGHGAARPRGSSGSCRSALRRSVGK